MRDDKLVRLDLVNCVIFCVTALGRTKLESGPMSVGRVSFVVTGFGFLLLLLVAGALDCVDDD